VKWFKFIFNPYAREGQRAVQVLLDDYGRAAAVATDLINTAPEVAVSTGDGLAHPAALAAFLARHELVLDALAGHPPVQGDLAAVHRLRRELRALVDTADPHGLASGLGRLLAAAATGPALVDDGAGDWRWQVRSRPGAGVGAELTVPLAAGLLGALRALGPDRFRQCASPACAGAFVDTSRGGRRRYCVPEICGNRINVANHRARRRATQR
jgi:predicted RNA-binding Zn ribbon-like protein